MTTSTHFTKRFVLAAALGLMIGATTPAYANVRFDISDLTEGIIPTLATSGTTATTVVIQNDSAPDFLHFTFTADLSSFGTTTYYSDLFEPGTNDAVSDRLLITFTSGSLVYDVKFDSRDTILLPQGINRSIAIFPVEDGTLQFMGGFANNSLPTTPAYQFFVASDVEPMPEPATILLLAMGFPLLMGFARKRKISA